ncbi:MAG: hypothetical protein J5I93_23465 [Pirellulaceae bacterium]|nr:hypothetical protein [Pirellulaceae bacterium]
MTNGILVSMMLLTLAGSPEDSRRTDWLANYGQALEAARFAQRPLLVVLDNPHEASQRFAPVDLGDATQQELLKPYQLCRVDVSTPYGKSVAAAFKADTFPHVAVIDKTATYIIHRHTGQVTSGQWATTLVRYQSGNRVAAASFSQPTNWSGGSRTSIICRT